jgi:hypothetical protein
MSAPQIHIFRHHNPIVVDQFMENFRSDLDPRKNLADQTSVNPTYLKVMKALAGMREAATRSNMSFFGGFVTPEGFHYSISNIENLIENQLQQPIDYYVNFQADENFTIDEIYKKLKIVSTEEGVQVRITDDNE